jgi:putative exporter of polyketide antibiotics
VAAAGPAAVGLAAGVLAWAVTAAQSGDVSLAEMLGAGANTLPAALLFLVIGALAFALAPRATAMIPMASSASPSCGSCSAHCWMCRPGRSPSPPSTRSALAPGESFKAGAATIMLGLAALLCVAALWAFRRRDLIGA